MVRQFQQLARRQLSTAMKQYLGPAANAPTPRKGWVAATREALGMSARDLGARLGIAPSNISRLEKREREGTITLDALRKAAAALDCEVVYAIVPRKARQAPDGSDNLLDAIILKHARDAAADDLKRVGKTMALEDQAIGRDSLDAQVEARAAQLAEDPRRVWHRGGKQQRIRPTRRAPRG